MIDMKFIVDAIIILSILLCLIALGILIWINISIFRIRTKRNKKNIISIMSPYWYEHKIANNTVRSNLKTSHSAIIEIYLDTNLQTTVDMSTKSYQAVIIPTIQEYNEKYSHNKNKSSTFFSLPWSHA